VNDNEFIATRVMGWISLYKENYHITLDKREASAYWYINNRDNSYTKTIPKNDWHPTTNIEQAFMCAEKVKDYKYELVLTIEIDGQYTASFNHTGNGPDIEITYAETPSQAIVSAIRKAVENDRTE